MASETLDTLDWPLPTPFTEHYSMSDTCTVQIGAASAGIDPETLCIRGNRHAYAATQGILNAAIIILL